ncbi:MAG: hypothetical protein ACTSX0_13940, partial [Promethearchaeota archaeon]
MITKPLIIVRKNFHHIDLNDRIDEVGKMNKNIVIVSACRTPIGAFGGSLKSVPAPQLAAHVMNEAVSRARID